MKRKMTAKQVATSSRQLERLAQQNRALKAKPKKEAPRQLVLSRAVYREMHALARWIASIPDWLELEDHAWERIEGYWEAHLGKYLKDDEGITVELHGERLVAVIDDQNGRETRVPISQKGATR